MPAAKRSTRSSSSRTRSFKEPAALKRLTKSLDSAQDALAELRKQGGRDVSQSAGAIYKDLRTFVSNARRHSGRLGKALARDFDQAQKKLAASSSGSSTRRSTTRAGSTRRSSSRSTTSRSTSASRGKRTGTASKRRSSAKK